ncbi:MAG: hypothetical protein LCH54_11745 [Bacteroidetes bacterium]|nr:hypothetical protein [Bacteroidota bacterium]
MSAFCSEFWEKKVGNFLNNPSLAVKNEVQDHIRTCLICRQSLDDMLGMRRILKNLPDAEPGEEFETNLNRRIQFIRRDRNRPIIRYFEYFNILFTVLIGSMIVLLFFLFSQVVENIEKKKQEEERSKPKQELILPD